MSLLRNTYLNIFSYFKIALFLVLLDLNEGADDTFEGCIRLEMSSSRISGRTTQTVVTDAVK